MYENYKLSSNLKPGWVEIVVERYSSGKMQRLHGDLVPKSRLNNGQHIPLLKSLVCHFGGLGFEQIVSAHLNNSSKKPPYASNPFQIVVAYPEPGVHRTYCGTDVKAWIDCVVSPKDFRQQTGGEPAADQRDR